MEEEMTSKQKDMIFILLFAVCLFILLLYAVKTQHDYNNLVVECNELRRNVSRGFFVALNESWFGGI